MVSDEVIENLPDEIKQFAELSCSEGILTENPVRTWLDGFVTALEGHVKVDWGWTPVTEKLPDKTGFYEVTLELDTVTPTRVVDVQQYDHIEHRWITTDQRSKVVAWKPRTPPYQETL